MTILKGFSALALALAVAACGDVSDKTRDQNIFDGGNGDLAGLSAGIWVDPQGCEHWIIDDGVEGYMDPRLTPDGKPVCNSELPRNTASGPFKAGSQFSDAI
ncbi:MULTISPECIES: hypothetical protein [unclassified Epibacterium]|jgi:hypothetical protein|uniref:hypothetical protein n=1 Tax=unclassified Epibacterium TaxID=2639179 RepID=UPI001EF55CCF|nr:MULTISPECIES: hypothetical protein [unclassified Epibacterium]MCG7622115.1 hypothetical protein [Epibacterium sp. Ofav1-8]MCG7626894.1 hypothetical protein [Epibacterium sp. MM17-32]